MSRTCTCWCDPTASLLVCVGQNQTARVCAILFQQRTDFLIELFSFSLSLPLSLSNPKSDTHPDPLFRRWKEKLAPIRHRKSRKNRSSDGNPLETEESGTESGPQRPVELPKWPNYGHTAHEHTHTHGHSQSLTERESLGKSRTRVENQLDDQLGRLHFAF